MIVTVSPAADVTRVSRALASLGLWAVRYRGEDGATAFVVQPHSGAVARQRILEIEGVDGVAEPDSAHPLVDGQGQSFEVSGASFTAGGRPVLLAGPCAVESPEQIDSVARRVAADGASFLRGGALKPRTSPYSFQGVGTEGLVWLRDAARAHGLGVVTEALGEASVEAVAEVADLIQVGSRNMHNSALLRAVAATGRPVLLKRGMAATVEEWLLAGELLLLHGARAVVFCERGIRGFDAATRNLLDVGAVAQLANVHRLPVVVDPSHALGRRDLILPLSLAACAAGACGILVETHDEPGEALSDGPQALPPAEFGELARALRRLPAGVA